MSETISNGSITMSKKAAKFVSETKFPMPRPSIIKVLARIPIKCLPYRHFKHEVDGTFKVEAAEKVQTMLNRLHAQRQVVDVFLVCLHKRAESIGIALQYPADGIVFLLNRHTRSLFIPSHILWSSSSVSTRTSCCL